MAVRARPQIRPLAISHERRRLVPLMANDWAGNRVRVAGGQDAMGGLACKEAAPRFQQVFQALDLSGPTPPSRRAEVLLALGEARRRAGELQPAVATFTEAATAARAAKTPELLARAALDFEEAFLPTEPATGRSL